MIEDGEEGVLVEPGDPRLLAEAIGKLANDPVERSRLGAAARERQARDFSVDAVVRQTTALYRESLGATTVDLVQASQASVE
jgi:glycosyltransferase involved in cell wall biosynthesis